MYKQHFITAVIPALDEERAIATVVKGLGALRDSCEQPIIDRIIVCDNGSRDHTAKLALDAGADVVTESRRGYGFACLAALAAIDTTDIVLFIDADNAFFPQQARALLAAIDRGADMVIGSRVLGHSDAKALTPAQRFGNRLATFLIRHLWGYCYTDLGPFRGIRWSALQQLAMADTHYGWTVEMQVKAIEQGLVISEVPVDTRVRIGQSKISGTISGTVKAGLGILTMIARLYWQSLCRGGDVSRRIKNLENRVERNERVERIV